jgi:hypothetical protein
MKCPGCGAAVESDQDFCMECGEPIAQAAVVDVESAAPPVRGAPAAPAGSVAAPVAAPTAKAPVKEVVKAARPKWKRAEEPEPVRCPGCGIPSRKTRCPGCGVRLRSDDD